MEPFGNHHGRQHPTHAARRSILTRHSTAGGSLTDIFLEALARQHFLPPTQKQLRISLQTTALMKLIFSVDLRKRRCGHTSLSVSPDSLAVGVD